MRRILISPSAVLPRLEDAPAGIGALDEFPNNIRIPVVECEVIEGYDAWAAIYDSGPNAATELDTTLVRSLLDSLPRGRALDAACGTGRQTLTLTDLGYDVDGIDLNETMLAIARDRVPAARFRQGRLDALPYEDAAFDVAVCSLALTHVVELLPALRELARVVKPGGYAVLSDMHPVTVHMGITAGFPAPELGADDRCRCATCSTRSASTSTASSPPGGRCASASSRRCPMTRSRATPRTRSCRTQSVMRSTVCRSC